MGINKSKTNATNNIKDKKSDHTEDIKIPNDFILTKVVTINLNLQNSINLKRNITKLVNYYFDNNLDIAVLQNFNDKISLFNFIKHLKTEAKIRKKNIFISPEFEDIDSYDTTKITIPINNTAKSDNEQFVPHLLISKYEIENYTQLFLNKNKSAFLLSSNIIIEGKIISIFIGSLSQDLKSLGVVNSEKRTIELMKIKRRVDKNLEIIEEEYGNNVSGINILFGHLPIDETYQNKKSSEYLKAIEICKVIDLHRYYDNSNSIITSKNNKRNDYIFLFLDDEFFEENTKLNDELQNVKTPKDMFNLLFKKYTFHLFEIDVEKEISIFDSYPITISFMFKYS